MWMMQKYVEHNKELVSSGHGPCFVVNLCSPGHLDACLKQFMQSIGAGVDNWDAQFSETWSSNDLADCIVSFAINQMMRRVVTGSTEGIMIIDSLQKNPRAATQFLLLAHLYSHEDAATLQALRVKLLPLIFSSWTVKKTVTTVGVVCCGVAVGSTGYKHFQPSATSIKEQFESPYQVIGLSSFVAGLSLAVTLFYRRRKRSSRIRGIELCKPLRIADARPKVIENLANRLFNVEDTSDRIRSLLIGHNAQQKLELLESLVKACGFDGLAVFGDCFDEVGLLDPLLYPNSLKVFAREVCKNEVLNQGQLHFFFPDARASLDLSTDRIVREARFDRHFVRDLSWSRFQLEDLAERRFLAAQTENKGMRFVDLFGHVSQEDFSGAISKLSTPRELMVFMTELLARVEARSEDGKMVAAQDMEIAVTKALEQSI